MPFKRSIDIIPYKLNFRVTKVSRQGGGFNEISNIPLPYIYTKTAYRDLRNPLLYIVIIASYGRATAAPVAGSPIAMYLLSVAWEL